MQNSSKNLSRLSDKTKLLLKFNYTSSFMSIAFGIACVYILEVKHIVPHAFFTYSILNLLNVVAFKRHGSLILMAVATSMLSLISTIIIVLYSGGITSPFIFVLALIVLAGYVVTRLFGKIYLYTILSIVSIIYAIGRLDLPFFTNEIPQTSRDLFGLLCALFSIYLLGVIFGMLYTNDNLSKIEFKPYAEELTAFLMNSVVDSRRKIDLNIDIPDLELGIDTAIPLGLLINETITNSLKYGFEGKDEGLIQIGLQKGETGENDYVLTISDNGVGFGDEVNLKSTKSLGLKLIHNLARQLQGSVTRDHSKEGTTYKIKFKDIRQTLSPVA